MKSSFFRKNNTSLQAIFIMIFLSSIVFYKDIPSFFLKVISIKILKNNELKNISQINFSSKAFENISVKAKACVVYDAITGKIIFSENATTTLPLASLTKVMTGITAISMVPFNRLITLHPMSIEDGYDLGLKNGQVWRLDELLKYTLIFYLMRTC